jgi:FkbM family methyltransferase
MKELIKKIPGAILLNHYLLQKKLMHQFLTCQGAEIYQLEFYRQFIDSNDLVFDVGANVGNRSKLFLNLKAKVCAYEPQKELCKHLNAYLKRNKSINIFNLGLGEKEGTQTIKICDGDAHVLSSMSQRWIDNTVKSGRFKDYQWTKIDTVNVSTLDLQIKKFGLPKFIKIDVEGYEYKVLKGLSKPVKYISFEFTSEDITNSIKCVQRLNEISNYNFQFSKGESFKFFFDTWIDGEKLLDSLVSKIKTEPMLWGDIYAINTIA